MDWNYISGFFDADGSITLYKNKSHLVHRHPQISFANNELNIIESIRAFIKKELNFNGSVCVKKRKESHHKLNYELKYLGLPKALMVLPHINSLHPKKRFRINIILNELQAVTPRNGKYTEILLEKRLNIQERFFSKFP